MPTTTETTYNANVKTLASKAILVKLTTSRPTTARREREAEARVQEAEGDTSLRVSSHIFAAATNPARVLINRWGAIYNYHVDHTIEYEKRGRRALPIASYETYTKTMRELMATAESETAKLMPNYPLLVTQDIAERTAAAIAKGRTPKSNMEDDYPSADEFQTKLYCRFLFSPVPDVTHVLFDMDEDDKAALQEQNIAAEEHGKQDVLAKLRKPLLILVEKLQKGIKTEGSIFRDSAVENIVEQCELAEELCMGDEVILEAIAEVRKAIRPHAVAIDQLRESPVVRAEAAQKLAAVAAKVSFLFDN